MIDMPSLLSPDIRLFTKKTNPTSDAAIAKKAYAFAAAKKCKQLPVRTCSGQDDEFEYVFILLFPAIQVIKAGTKSKTAIDRPLRQPISAVHPTLIQQNE